MLSTEGVESNSYLCPITYTTIKNTMMIVAVVVTYRSTFFNRRNMRGFLSYRFCAQSGQPSWLP